MRVEIEIHGGTLAVGHDSAVSFFATLTRGSHRYEYGVFADGYDRERPLQGLVHWLVAHGVFNEDDLDEAMLAYADLGDDDGEEQLSPGGQIALQVIEGLKRAAAE